MRAIVLTGNGRAWCAGLDIGAAEGLDIETVTEIFIRVNSAGAELSQADFAMSKIAANETYGGNFDLRPAHADRVSVFEHDIPGLFAGRSKGLSSTKGGPVSPKRSWRGRDTFRTPGIASSRRFGA